MICGDLWLAVVLVGAKFNLPVALVSQGAFACIFVGVGIVARGAGSISRTSLQELVSYGNILLLFEEMTTFRAIRQI